MQINLNRAIQIAFFNFLLVAIIGCFLRCLFIKPVAGINYAYILHAHSHLAFLGWVFMALYALLVHAYLPAQRLYSRKYLWMFLGLQLANLGMLATFPFMGYALWSIIFSAMHALIAMLFAWHFIRDSHQHAGLAHKTSIKWITWALLLMILSNLAPFALGPVSATMGRGDLYYLLIYFYLHFQYNAWFTFAILGLILWQLEISGVNTDTRLVKLGFRLKLIAVFPAYILSALWTSPEKIWYFIAGLAAILQLAGLICLLVFLFKYAAVLMAKGSFLLKLLLIMGLLALFIQHLLMSLSVIPSLGHLAFARNIVIAYLHLVLIGFVTVLLFFHFLKLNLIRMNGLSRFGILIFLMAFVLTEIILVFQGQIANNRIWLFYLALLQLAGILILTFNVKRIAQ